MATLSELLRAARPLVMGVLNVTPDSFSDGGLYSTPEDALARVDEMLAEGVDIVDIGGESTRPGAAPVSAGEESERVLPVVAAIRARFDVIVSVDTSSAVLMAEASRLGVDLINDVRALQRDGALSAAAQSDAHICLMHMQGEPASMQDKPRYDHLSDDINAFFTARIEACLAAGIDRSRLLLDPGFGFGKTPAHNLALIRELATFGRHQLPILVGLSRKSTVARVSRDLVSGSVAGALLALQNGARIVRVHDVAQTVAAIEMWRAVTGDDNGWEE